MILLAFLSAFAQDQGPKLLEAATPTYPAAALADHVTGTVVLRLALDETGAVASSEVIQSVRAAVDAAIARAPDESLRRLGTDFRKAIDNYAREAAAAGSSFVEIQNTMLFATVGQRTDA